VNIGRASTRVTIMVAMAVAAAVTWVAAHEPAAIEMQQLPDGVTSDMVRDGGGLFRTDALCHACHGVEGKGVANLGPDLTDDEWKHIDGSYTATITLITVGITAEESSSGIPMPPRAGANLTDDQVRMVAAYVWTLSRTE